ncbi:MAG: hypothetical protein CVV48_03325 [Spirochaetae bacterium HGW-Spirochaetae-4]|nr:MAG: hypothetical protein A2Y31_11425 [Spirochaetes bacterium GWC2_52_13]OHD65539.1 MAG: hypothetical protein A2101_01940 [Spirochaetes bacterium GWF2_52_7]PKL22346.1 MAG: hypothetical protein CVV48_03325 [Spirochaetae bacterium HGW-Spirochaetae-4]HCG63800.1 hypothetical protein [Sphaerochaeta sp.]HCS36169.1 hypothetical protein [Sphaerochaeta sp.]
MIRRVGIKADTDVDWDMAVDGHAVFTAMRLGLGCVEEKCCFPAVIMTGTSFKKIASCCIQVFRKCQLPEIFSSIFMQFLCIHMVPGTKFLFCIQKS